MFCLFTIIQAGSHKFYTTGFLVCESGGIVARVLALTAKGCWLYMDFVYSLILGVVEGLTEFLPISSTGHLLVASALLNFPPVETKGFRTTFDIFIQIGAVLAVLIYYWRDLTRQAQQLPSNRDIQRFWFNIFIAFLPAATIGFLTLKIIEESLSTPLPIGLALILGGIVFLVVDHKDRPGTVHNVKDVSTKQALAIGVAQVASLIPGVSRSGASIVGGLLVGLDRLTATTFSFYLFIPTLGGATLYKLYTALRDQEIGAGQLPLLAVGTLAAFVVSYASIVWLLRYVSSHTFRVFGVYRIIAGIVIIVWALLAKV